MDVSAEVAEDVPEQAQEVTDVHDNEPKFEDLQPKVDHDHRADLVVVVHNVVSHEWVVLHFLIQNLGLYLFNPGHQLGDIKNLEAVYEAHDLDHVKVHLDLAQVDQIGHWNQWDEVVDEAGPQVPGGDLGEVPLWNGLSIWDVLYEESQNHGYEKDRFKKYHHIE